MKKGFTLIELLGVIVILAIIMSITTVVMINIINNTHKTIDESTLKILYAQATEYINEEYVVPANGDFKVTLKTLRENNKIILRLEYDGKILNEFKIRRKYVK